MSSVGLLTRSSKSTRRHALEILNNMMYLRDACFELTTTDIPSSLRSLISSWLKMEPCDLYSSGNHIRVLHSLDCEDPLLSSLFTGDITYYSTAFIGKVRFTTSDYAMNKVADDSNIVFKIGDEQSWGCIRRIFRVNHNEPVFYVAVAKNLVPFQCHTPGHVYNYANIQTGVYDEEPTNVFLTSKHVIEKCVRYERDDGVSTFFRYPSLQGSL